MNRKAPREWQTLNYIDPTRVLIGLGAIAQTLPLNNLGYYAASLRTRELRPYGEARQAALFCYGMSRAMNRHVDFAMVEAQDYDAVARFADNQGALVFAPVQLKEWVPGFLNPSATLQKELDKLDKYVDSEDLVVAIFMNRTTTIHLSELILPRGRIGELWLYGGADSTQTRWMFIGDLLSDNPQYFEFSYPVDQPSDIDHVEHGRSKINSVQRAAVRQHHDVE